MVVLSPGLRKVCLALHLTVSVGWVGAVAAYLVLDVSAATTRTGETARAAYVAMELIVRFAIMPLAFASLGTGLVVSAGTKWGLFKHYWVVISLVMTLFATVVLVIESSTVRFYARVAETAAGPDRVLGIGNTLLHSIGGLVVLLVVLVLNVWKPQGVTRYGRQAQRHGAESTRPV